MKFKRKKIIIDKFQLRAAFSIVGTVAILTAVILSVIAVFILQNNKRIDNINEIQNSIVNYLTTLPVSENDHALRQAIDTAEKNHNLNKETLLSIMKMNKLLLLGMLIAFFAQAGALYLILIRRTHRISGPIYVMSNYINEIIEGKYPTPRRLRDKDELKKFYSLFRKMCEVLRERSGASSTE